MMCVLKKKEKVSRGHVLSQIILVAMVMYIYIWSPKFQTCHFRADDKDGLQYTMQEW